MQSDGNVGIGLTSPNAKLYVFDNSANYNAVNIKQINLGGHGLQIDVKSTSGSQNLFLAESIDGSGTINQGSEFIIKSNGNVGIGSNNPTEKLDVEGSIQVDGDYTYETAKTRVYSLGETDFNIGDPRSGILYRVWGNGGVSIINSTAQYGHAGRFSAPVHLPNGAKVDSIKVFFIDNSDSHATASLLGTNNDGAYMSFRFLKRLNSGGAIGIGDVTTSSSSSSVNSLLLNNIPSNLIINNQNNTYYFDVYSNHWSENNKVDMKVISVLIYYTVTKAD